MGWCWEVQRMHDPDVLERNTSPNNSTIKSKKTFLLYFVDTNYNVTFVAHVALSVLYHSTHLENLPKDWSQGAHTHTPWVRSFSKGPGPGQKCTVLCCNKQ